MDKQSIAVGGSKGFPVTKRAQKQKPSNRKGAVVNAKGDNKVVRRKVNFVRDLIREVMGLAPYEKRVVGSFP
jgi:large subunit ribosomal protein L36e